MIDNNSIDQAAEIVATRAPHFFKGVMMAPLDKRPVLLALISLDVELWAASHASSEDMVNAIKLAWWSEALERLPKRADDHPVLQAIMDSRSPLDVACQMVAAFQESRESLPILIRALSQHLGANELAMNAVIHSVGDQTHKPQKWPKPARPIIVMLKPLTKFQMLKLLWFGYA